MEKSIISRESAIKRKRYVVRKIEPSLQREPASSHTPKSLWESEILSKDKDPPAWEPDLLKLENGALVERVLVRLWVRKEWRGVAVHVHDFNAIECLFAWLKNMSGFFDPLELFEPVVTGAESSDRIAGLGIFHAHCLTSRYAYAPWPLYVAWLPSPCAVCG